MSLSQLDIAARHVAMHQAARSRKALQWFLAEPKLLPDVRVMQHPCMQAPQRKEKALHLRACRKAMPDAISAAVVSSAAQFTGPSGAFRNRPLTTASTSDPQSAYSSSSQHSGSGAAAASSPRNPLGFSDPAESPPRPARGLSAPAPDERPELVQLQSTAMARAPEKPLPGSASAVACAMVRTTLACAMFAVITASIGMPSLSRRTLLASHTCRRARALFVHHVSLCRRCAHYPHVQQHLPVWHASIAESPTRLRTRVRPVVATGATDRLGIT